MLGNIDDPFWYNFNRGCFIASFYPHELKIQVEKAITRPEIFTQEMRNRLQTLNKSITEDNNNILFIGKLRE